MGIYPLIFRFELQYSPGMSWFWYYIKKKYILKGMYLANFQYMFLVFSTLPTRMNDYKQQQSSVKTLWILNMITTATVMASIPHFFSYCVCNVHFNNSGSCWINMPIYILFQYLDMTNAMCKRIWDGNINNSYVALRVHSLGTRKRPYLIKWAHSHCDHKVQWFWFCYDI